ncbi:MAG TPA: hypothetical protein VJX67_16145, partial [Blastocatellia bacterium]|nr:hypothetical protein [Blastocatellia bacterium]
SRWLSDGGRPLDEHESSVPLRYDLPPGSETVLVLNLRAPSTPGDYILELDMAQGEKDWFATKGSKVLRIPAVINRYDAR